jgi:hypothetical protein
VKLRKTPSENTSFNQRLIDEQNDMDDIEKVFADSEALADQLHALTRLPLFDDSERIRVSDLLCSLSFEHWAAIRQLLAAGLLPSALVVHRAQFEAVVRSIWALYAATDGQIARLSDSQLTLESEQAAKNLPLVHEMMEALAKKAPAEAFQALERFKTHSWLALNSYTHSGIHPIRRHESGYPIELIDAALSNANGLAVLGAMQAVALSGVQPLQRAVLDLAAQYPHCMPPPL